MGASTWTAAFAPSLLAEVSVIRGAGDHAEAPSPLNAPASFFSRSFFGSRDPSSSGRDEVHRLSFVHFITLFKKSFTFHGLSKG